MKNQFFAALLLTAATVVIAPTANAAESKSVENIQSTRLEQLDSQSKSIKDIQAARLDFLSNQTKAVEDI